MTEEKALSDAQLVEMAKSEPESFGLLMERYQGQLSGYIRRLTQLAADDAQDLLQEVFIKIYQNLNAYDGNLKFSSWAYRIAHNQVVDYFRRSGARPQTAVLEDYEWEKIIGGGIQLEKDIVDRDCAEKVRACIEDLPLNYREILILRFVEEKDYEEIMDILKKPKGSVATLIARGKEMLRSEMEKRNINCF
ncbi:MAG: RNA polymerase sigma factor [Parcubacteria group bacterium]